jgi:hypothetical protein
MRKIPWVILCLFPFVVSGQIIVDRPLSPGSTVMTSNVTLDPERTSLVSDECMVGESLFVPVGEAMMHMYLNAFSCNKSTFTARGRWSAAGEDGWGWVKINSIIDGKGNDLIDSIGFVSPDDGNEYDKTVLRIALPAPVSSGDTLFLAIDFKSKLPSPIQRTG